MEKVAPGRQERVSPLRLARTSWFRPVEFGNIPDARAQRDDQNNNVEEEERKIEKKRENERDPSSDLIGGRIWGPLRPERKGNEQRKTLPKKKRRTGSQRGKAQKKEKRSSDAPLRQPPPGKRKNDEKWCTTVLEFRTQNVGGE